MHLPTPRSSCQSRYAGALITALGTLGTAIAVVAFAAPATADGSPILITPDAPFVETFGTGPSRSTLTTYESNLDQTYTASKYWLSNLNCNGIVLSYDISGFNTNDCNAPNNSSEKTQEQKSIKVKAAALGLLDMGKTGGTYNGAGALGAAAENRALSTNTTSGSERSGNWQFPGNAHWPISVNSLVGGNYNTPAQVMVASERPIMPTAGSAFLELSVDYAATACATTDQVRKDMDGGRGNPNPHLVFQWLNAPPETATEANVVQSSAPVDICGNDPSPVRFESMPICSVLTSFAAPVGVRTGGYDYTIDNQVVHAVRANSPIAQLFSSKDIGNTGLWYRILNVTDEQNGNDGALDNVRVTVATPSISKSFGADPDNPVNQIVAGQLTWVEFTIKNSDDLAEKTGWSVTDTLDPGLHLALADNEPRTDCGTPSPLPDGSPGPIMQVLPGTTSDGRESFTIKDGTIGAGMAVCHVWVPVVAEYNADDPGSTVGNQYANCVAQPPSGDGGFLDGSDGIELPDPDQPCASITVVEPNPDPNMPTAPSCPGGEFFAEINGEWVCVIPTPPTTVTPPVCTDDEALVDNGSALVCLPKVPPNVVTPPACPDGQLVVDNGSELVCLPESPPDVTKPPVCTDDETMLNYQGTLVCAPKCDEGQALVDDNGTLQCVTPVPLPVPPSIANPPVCADGSQVVVTENGILCGVVTPPQIPGPMWPAPIKPGWSLPTVNPLPVSPGNPFQPVDPPDFPGNCPPDSLLPSVKLPPVSFNPPSNPQAPNPPRQLTDTGVSQLVLSAALGLTVVGLGVLNCPRARRN